MKRLLPNCRTTSIVHIVDIINVHITPNRCNSSREHSFTLTEAKPLETISLKGPDNIEDL